MKTPWVILYDDMYSMVETASKPAIEAQYDQRKLPGRTVDTPSDCELLSGPSPKIDPQTREAVYVGYCLMLFCQISEINYAPLYSL